MNRWITVRGYANAQKVSEYHKSLGATISVIDYIPPQNGYTEPTDEYFVSSWPISLGKKIDEKGLFE